MTDYMSYIQAGLDKLHKIEEEEERKRLNQIAAEERRRYDYVAKAINAAQMVIPVEFTNYLEVVSNFNETFPRLTLRVPDCYPIDFQVSVAGELVGKGFSVDGEPMSVVRDEAGHQVNRAWPNEYSDFLLALAVAYNRKQRQDQLVAELEQAEREEMEDPRVVLYQPAMARAQDDALLAARNAMLDILFDNGAPVLASHVAANADGSIYVFFNKPEIDGYTWDVQTKKEFVGCLAIQDGVDWQQLIVNLKE